MTATARDFSVVIRCYTQARWKSLVMAVQSVQAQRLAAREVVIVVDHNPALEEAVRTHLPGVRVVANHEPQGSAGAWNSGVNAAQGELIAFMDDDAVAAPDWLEQLAAGYDDPQVVGVGGTIEPVWLDGRPAWFPDEFGWVIGCTYRGLPEVVAPVRNLIGCNMSFRRQVFEAVGGFRHGIGHVAGQPFGCDETELCIRLRQHWPQAELRHAPAARVYHQIPGSRGRFAYFRRRCAMEGRSKALVAGLVGTNDGTSTERAYALRTLPRGVARGLRDALHGDASGMARAAAISAGLAITGAAYLRARLNVAFGKRQTVAPVPPIAARGAG